jgi:DNA-binding NtrC family response regulator
MSNDRATGHTILVVDDDENVREITTEMLRRAGYVVARASDRDAALGSCRELPISLAVLDVVMPVMSGPDLLGELRVVRPNLPAIFMSGKPLEHIGEVPGPFLAKPFTREALLATVRNVLAEQSTTS